MYRKKTIHFRKTGGRSRVAIKILLTAPGDPGTSAKSWPSFCRTRRQKSSTTAKECSSHESAACIGPGRARPALRQVLRPAHHPHPGGEDRRAGGGAH